MDMREIGVLAVALLLGGLMGGGVTYLRDAREGSIASPDCPKVHQFIDPALNCVDADQLFQSVSETEAILKQQIQDEKQLGNAERVSIFYRDLYTKRWLGIRAEDSFAPGSLLKLPLAIAYFKLSEIDPGVLTQQYTFNGVTKSLNDMEHVKPSRVLEIGKSYSTVDLIEQMIARSDNDMVPVLSNGINTNFFNKVYLDLGVHFPTSGGIEQNFVSVKTYAGILRSLYLSSYLSASDSEKMLSIMAKSDFNAVRAGLPEGMLYANKFGERGIDDKITGMKYQLHDCGIVYHPTRPYIICAMTEGKDFDKLKGVISRISKIVYDRQ